MPTPTKQPSLFSNNISRHLSFLVILLIYLVLIPASVHADFDPAVLKSQLYLDELGYEPGPIDGQTGKRTKLAVQTFQHDHHLPVTGEIDRETLELIINSAPDIHTVTRQTLTGSVNIEYVTNELKSAFNDGVIIPKEGMKFVVVDLLIDNGPYRNLAMDLNQVAVVTDDRKLHISKAYSVIGNSYFAHTYYEDFKGLVNMAAGGSPAPVIEFEQNILKLLGVPKNKRFSFRFVCEIPDTSKVQALAWYGVTFSLKIPLPKNGAVQVFVNKERIAPLHFVTKGEKVHYFVKLSDWNTGEKVQTIFIRAGETVESKVPLGAYRLKYAAGSEWLDKVDLFGEKTIFKKAKKKFEFAETSNEVTGYRVELILQPGGNLPTLRIPKSEW